MYKRATCEREIACGLLTRILRGACLCLAVTMQAAGQAPIELQGGVTLTTTQYNSEIAKRFNLASRGWGFQGTFSPRIYRYVGLLAEVGWEYWGQVCLDPTSCEPDLGSTSTLTASLGGGLVSPVLYVNDPQGRVGFGLTVHGGREWIKSGLSSDGCLNCPIGDLNVDGGYWIEAGLNLHAHPSVVIGFVYRVYEKSADMNSRIAARVIGRWY